MSTWYIRTFFESNEYFQQTLQLWEFSLETTAKSYPVPLFVVPYIEACIEAVREGKICPDFDEPKLEEEGVQTVDNIVVRTGPEEDCSDTEESSETADNIAKEDSDTPEVEWTNWCEILSSYYEWLKFHQESN